jgi:stage II sporulation protein AA (anti-sigma F factor antagonist)
VTLSSHIDDRATVTLVGRFDAVEAAVVREFLGDERLAAVRHLTIDLSDVSFVDSAGLAVLARSRRDLGLAGGSVTLVRPASDDAMRVFRLTQFDEIFTMIDTAEDERH